MNKPSLGNDIPSRYKVTLSDLDRRMQAIEHRFNINRHPTTFESANTDTIEYNGHLVRRDLSSGLYKVLDISGKQVIDGDFNQLMRAQSTIDSRVNAQKLMEDRA